MHRDICRITTLTAIIAIVLDAAPAMTGEWDKFTTEDGLADNVVYSILEDSGGDLWFGTAAGVSGYLSNEIGALLFRSLIDLE